MDNDTLQMIAVNLGPWAFVAYLVFQLLTSALDKRHKGSGTAPQAGADAGGSLPPAEYGSDPQNLGVATGGGITTAGKGVGTIWDKARNGSGGTPEVCPAPAGPPSA